MPFCGSAASADTGSSVSTMHSVMSTDKTRFLI